ncbi:MAG TPA: hypothetical protein VFG37_08280 [Planctomycetota bacterium]|nr:hypothetical protein [Planctomycetota bacterium]
MRTAILALACLAIARASEGGRGEMTLGELVSIANSRFGAPLLVEPRDRKKVMHLDPAALELQGAPFTVAFEAALHDAGLVDVEHRLGRARAHEIVRIADTRERNAVFETARRLVGLAELESMSERWSYVTALVICRGPPPREVAERLGELCDDTLRRDARAIDGTDALLLSGFARHLSALGPMLAVLGAEVVTPDDVPSTPAAPPPGGSADPASVVFTGTGGELPLSKISDAISRLLGEPIFDSSAALARATIAFEGRIEIDRDSALEWFDLLLARVHFVRTTRRIGPQRVHEVVATRFDGRGVGRCRGAARWIGEDEIASTAGEFVSTTAHARLTYPREYVGALAKHFSGDSASAIREVEGSDVVLVTGPADELGFVLRIVREIERHASSR